MILCKLINTVRPREGGVSPFAGSIRNQAGARNHSDFHNHEKQRTMAERKTSGEIKKKWR